jgi:16S rRNA (cytosine967-C5)-methyltransferase
MHPKALLEACADLVGLVLKFDHPADQVVSRFFREHREFGPRERATLAETVYTVLRKKLLFDHLSPSGSGPKERRMAILGFHGPRDFLKSALNDTEKRWLDNCDAVKPDDLLERHRHNLPEWLVAPLKAQLGAEFWRLAESLQQPAPLDLRVNTLTDKRPDVQKELALAAIKAVATPFSPWGLRVDGKPALAKLDAFARGAVEVQDEGSQLLALLLDAKRGEMVVDFCAGAGGKTLAIGATMRNTGRLYAFDTSAHRLDALKPRLARSKLSNVHPAAIAHERDERIKRLAGKIDRVLVDAPCSGLGTLRRNPDLKWRQSPKSVEELTAKQAAILQSAARLVKSGGAPRLRHLQRAAGGERGHRRGLRCRQPRIRAAGRRGPVERAQGRRRRGPGRRRGRRQALSASLAAPSCYRWLLCRGLEPEVGRKTQRRQITRDGSRI